MDKFKILEKNISDKIDFLIEMLYPYMFFKCEKCNTNFTYPKDKDGYIACPKCGLYNSASVKISFEEWYKKERKPC